MEDLIRKIEDLKRSKIKETIDSRLKEFKEVEDVFSELCFCICTANNSAERGLRAQREIDFRSLSEPELRKKMRELVCRFYKSKTDYIISARLKKDKLLDLPKDGKDAREWLVKNIRGLGFKEASHFLRNIGYQDIAIIDFHILDLLEKHGLIKRPKTLTKRTYLEIEDVLREIATRTGLNLAELDLYLWYMETGKVLK